MPTTKYTWFFLSLSGRWLFWNNFCRSDSIPSRWPMRHCEISSCAISSQMHCLERTVLFLDSIFSEVCCSASNRKWIRWQTSSMAQFNDVSEIHQASLSKYWHRLLRLQTIRRFERCHSSITSYIYHISTDISHLIPDSRSFISLGERDKRN